MFCPECGNRVEKTDLFCENCGFNLKEFFQREMKELEENTPMGNCSNAAVASPPTEAIGNTQESTLFKFFNLKNFVTRLAAGVALKLLSNNISEVLYTAYEFFDMCAKDTDKRALPSCIMFTNIKSIALSMNVEQKVIKSILNKFIEEKSSIGLNYHLLDAGDYTYQKKGFWSSGKHVSLGPDNDVWEYMDVLGDFNEKITKETGLAPEYLFIIGGDNVIPMPCIRHYIKNDKHDDTIDTDLLYAYPYGEKVLALFENMEIFKYDQQFFIGRLPFGNDASIEDLYNYLYRDLEQTLGVELNEAYGQCDPNWKRTSTAVADEVIAGDYMRNYDGRLTDEHYFNRMILSPMVYNENVHQIFNTEAQLYYYNLHGGNAVRSKGYFGAIYGTNQTVPVIEPEHKRTCKNPNFVISEACYGARFIGLDKEHSMMLSSIHNKTMAFVGSSRVAWGAVDRNDTAAAGLSYADTLAKYYMKALMQGATAGQALYLARYSVLQSCHAGDLKAALTVTEFNLYGDPLMAMGVPREKISLEKAVTPGTPFHDKNIVVGCDVEEVKCKGEESSLLARIRNAVDNNIMQIHEKINRQLYASYGIEPRNIDSIFKVRYADGYQELEFNYVMSDKDAEIPVYMSVTSTDEGKITNVTTSKKLFEFK